MQDVTYTEIVNGCSSKQDVTEMPVADEERAFHAILDVRGLVRAYSLHSLDLTLTAGQAETVGAVYEGSIHEGENNHVKKSRYEVVDISNNPRMKIVELLLEHSDISRVLYKQTWRFEVKSGIMVLTREIIESAPTDPFLLGMVVVLSPVILIGFILTPCMLCAQSPTKNRMFEVYRYLQEHSPSGEIASGEIAQALVVQGNVMNEEGEDRVDKLNKLFEMLKAGVISKAEFDQLKEEVMPKLM